jgi:hypothetical protein
LRRIAEKLKRAESARTPPPAGRYDNQFAVSGKALWRGRGRSLSFALLLAVLAFDALEDFFAVNGNVFGGVDTDANLITLDAENGHTHRIANHQGFADAAGQNKHFLITP